MDKKEMIRRLKKFVESKGIDPQLIDFEALVDSNLTYQENKKIIVDEMKKIKENFFAEDADLEALEAQFNKYYKQQLLEEFNKEIEEIRERETPELDKYFRVLKELVKIVVEGDAAGLVVYGEAGLGKTYTVLLTLAQLGKVLGRDYKYISTHITPLELVNILWENNDRIIVLDDVEKLLLEEKTLGILKSALWPSAGGKRIITYYSTTERLRAPSEFEFSGKVILLLNKIPKRNKEIVKSLLSRVLSYRLYFNYRDRLKIMYELSKILKIGEDVVDFLKERFSPALRNFNFRTLMMLKTIKDYYDSNGGNWQSIAERLLSQNVDRRIKVVWELMNSGLSVNEQVKRFKELTGLSRRTYFRIKSKISELMGLSDF